MRKLLRFPADSRALPVTAGAGALDRERITAVATVREARGDVVVALLEANGWRIAAASRSEQRHRLGVGRAYAPPPRRLHALQGCFEVSQGLLD